MSKCVCIYCQIPFSGVQIKESGTKWRVRVTNKGEEERGVVLPPVISFCCIISCSRLFFAQFREWLVQDKVKYRQRKNDTMLDLVFTGRVACVAGGLFGVFFFYSFVVRSVRETAAQMLYLGRNRNQWGRRRGKKASPFEPPAPCLTVFCFDFLQSRKGESLVGHV